MRNIKGISRISAVTLFLAQCTLCVASAMPAQESPEKIAAQIDSIVQRAATPMELSNSSDPVRITSSQITFDPKDVAEVQRYGSDAVPALSKYVLNKNARVERVAIRLLGAIGGPAVITPLLEVLEKSPSAAGRNEALLNLKQSPCTKAVGQAIQRAAKSDADANVRTQAQEELSWCGAEVH
jgi:hypothetical protein